MKQVYNYYKLGCNFQIDNINKGLTYNCKLINFKLSSFDKKYHIKYQYIDIRNKCRYVILNNDYLIPVYSSGSLHNVKIIKSYDDYLLDLFESLNNINIVAELINIDFLMKSIFFSIKNDKKFITSIEFENNISINIKDTEWNNSVKDKFISFVKDKPKIRHKKELKFKDAKQMSDVDVNIFKKTFDLDDRIIPISFDVINYHTSEILSLALTYELIHSAGFKCQTIAG